MNDGSVLIVALYWQKLLGMWVKNSATGAWRN